MKNINHYFIIFIIPLINYFILMNSHNVYVFNVHLVIICLYLSFGKNQVYTIPCLMRELTLAPEERKLSLIQITEIF